MTIKKSQIRKEKKVLDIKELYVEFRLRDRTVHAVNDLSFAIHRGEIVCLVGESACGKSVTALSITRLIPCPPGYITSGSINFLGQNLLTLSEQDIRKLRGSHISTIFQEPMTSLNPLLPIGKQISDIHREHSPSSSRKLDKQRAMELLRQVRIPDPEHRYYAYPHQLSGGMRQRIMIAMALASGSPELLIADEPSTALDVTVQAQILSLLQDIQQNTDLSILLITHDMGVVAQAADWIVVIYAGKKVEEGTVEAIFNKPSHPYTQGLLNSIPSHASGVRRLETIEGIVGESSGFGCPFALRCKYVRSICTSVFPAPTELREDHTSWCHAIEELP